MSKLAIAPMVDWTDQYFRLFMRILAPHATSYTEMHSVDAILHQPERTLENHPHEHPVSLQVGGHDPAKLAQCCQLAEKQGFVEINLNLGCPSPRVQSGRFGVCLMREPSLVSDCIQAMKEATTLPITAKVRIGVDQEDSYDFFSNFVRMLTDANIDKLIVHARKAWLHGLNPKQNRTIPPLHYPYVYNIKQAYPTLPVIINGNIRTVTEVHEHLQHVDGVMLGRLACDAPYDIAKIHHALYPDTPRITRFEALQKYFETIQQHTQHIKHHSRIIKPLMNLSHALPHAKSWKQRLHETKDIHNDKAQLALLALMEKMEQNCICSP